MARRACDGDGLLDAFRAAVANLEAHVDEINGLNVYPVPDGDTGSNMLATVKAALDEAEAVAGEPADRVAAAISFGALMGARGNSGVITSQIFRGMAEGLGGKRRFNGLDLAHALSEGARTAYGAVAKPVEGTILTVIRESAAAAVAAAERDNDIETVLWPRRSKAPRSRWPGRRACSRSCARPASSTPVARALPAVPGRALHLTGQTPVGAARGATAPGSEAEHARGPRRRGLRLRDDVPAAARRRHRLDVDAIRDHLESIGESVLVAGDARALKVHVHNERPDLVIGYGLSLGDLSRITVENLDNQAQDVRETKAAEFTGPGRRQRTEHRRARRRCRWRRGTGARGPPRPGGHRGRRRATAWPRSSATSASRRSSGVASRRTRAPASCCRRSVRSRPAKSCCCRTTRTWSSPRARSHR